MLKVIYPNIFEDCDFINAVFTESNREIHNTGRLIPGLNFGINTEEDFSIIKKNIHLLGNATGFPSERMALAKQVHSARVSIIKQPGIYNDTDGLITNKKKLPLGIQVADCAAVLVGDIHNQIIGAFHAGWRGASDHIISEGLNKMKSLTDKDPLYKVFISPCISLKNFEVGHEVASRFPERFCDYESFQKPHVDLKAFIMDELVNSGVNPDHIETTDYCTIENSNFYSYRRERNKAGRMLASIVLI